VVALSPSVQHPADSECLEADQTLAGRADGALARKGKSKD
jgi:hypothetical protein